MLPRASCPPFELAGGARFRARRVASSGSGSGSAVPPITPASAVTRTITSSATMADAEAERKAKADRAKKLVSWPAAGGNRGDVEGQCRGGGRQDHDTRSLDDGWHAAGAGPRAALTGDSGSWGHGQRRPQEAQMQRAPARERGTVRGPTSPAPSRTSTADASSPPAGNRKQRPRPSPRQTRLRTGRRPTRRGPASTPRRPTPPRRHRRPSPSRYRPRGLRKSKPGPRRRCWRMVPRQTQQTRPGSRPSSRRCGSG